MIVVILESLNTANRNSEKVTCENVV
jgi:hypothetical protein